MSKKQIRLYQPIWTIYAHNLPKTTNRHAGYVLPPEQSVSKDVNRWLKQQGDAQSFARQTNDYSWPSSEYGCFTHKAIEFLGDVLINPYHEVYTFMLDEWPLCYLIRPVAAPVNPISTYAEIAASLTNDVHYLRKFEGTEFTLVTETFAERFQQFKLKGLKFHLRWDGEKSYPPVEHLSRAWLEEQMRKKGDL